LFWLVGVVLCFDVCWLGGCGEVGGIVFGWIDLILWFCLLLLVLGYLVDWYVDWCVDWCEEGGYLWCCFVVVLCEYVCVDYVVFGWVGYYVVEFVWCVLVVVYLGVEEDLVGFVVVCDDVGVIRIVEVGVGLVE